ncbi:MAG: hypothetical protein ACXWZT_09760 [Gaiellaceae bacterium]
MSPLRVICVLAAGAALAAALALGEPEVFAPLWLCGLVLFVVGAGSIAADAVPLRSRLALACSVLTPVAAIGLVTAGFAGVPPLVAVVPPLLITLAPVAAPRLLR